MSTHAFVISRMGPKCAHGRGHDGESSPRELRRMGSATAVHTVRTGAAMWLPSTGCLCRRGTTGPSRSGTHGPTRENQHLRYAAQRSGTWRFAKRPPHAKLSRCPD